MQVTVNIPDELAAQVRARGESPERFVNRLVEEASRAARNGSASFSTGDLDLFFAAISANSDKIPQLPDEAFTRESFYGESD
jgi:hypothetical protein